MDAEMIASLAEYFPIPKNDSSSIVMSQLRDSLYMGEALRNTLGSRQALPPPISDSDGQPTIFEYTTPHDFSPEDHKIQDDLKSTFLDVRGIPFGNGGPSHILIREEYETVFQYLCSVSQEVPNCHGVTITGQSGIGKSLCLYYLLVRRPLQGLPVAFQVDSKYVLLFLESGTYVIPNTGTLDLLPDRIWALVDSTARPLVKPADFLSSPSSPFFLIQAASHSPAAPFQPSEIPLTLMGLYFVFRLFGPSARGISTRVFQIKQYLHRMRCSALQTIFRDVESTSSEHICHQVFFIFPDPQSRSSPRYDTPSKYVGKLLRDCWVLKDRKKTQEMRAYHATLSNMKPKSRSPEGDLFQQFPHPALFQRFYGTNISELPITLKGGQYWYDTDVRQANRNIRFEPRTPNRRSSSA
ncbi:hypothetical protein BOTBODRAFT_646798 [Botryobasidium botryosum FD-172 SS1]|uniref:Uncharacterized protein n=1 Tax=Botryobasidium botryosum (strain FD-172 SS1) TaxID=930990 RepID=A0A067MPL6_BOTB1|nr:hypothetical protein BOTBODRAFT_646798 [Botryobasidium botryosum FD-172 SS1]